MEQRASEKTAVSQLEQALASGPIGKTIMFYAVPAVISLVVNGLYNIVDQIFIGQGIGYLGNSASHISSSVEARIICFGIVRTSSLFYIG